MTTQFDNDPCQQEYCCDTPRPDGFTYHPSGVTVCNKCYTKFPYYDCFCELDHDCKPEV